jgi:hypothetical protein
MINVHFKKTLIMLGLLAATGCNMPSSKGVPSAINVTQAYQTVAVHLTAAVGLPSDVVTETLVAPPPLPDGGESTPMATATTTRSTPSPICDQAAAAYPKIDITINDNTEMVPGQTFTKIWRVVNVGTCPWTTAYAVVLFSGDRLGASENIAFTQSIVPNQTVDISVDMVAPTDPGAYQGNWKLRNASGGYFGIGPSGSSPFWVRIDVIQVLTSTPTATPTITPTPIIQVSGNPTLAIDQYIDLDYMGIDSAAGDLLYQYDAPTEHQLIPQGSAVLGIFGSVQPGLADCQAIALGNSVLRMEDIEIGTYICYRTDLGLYGWLRFDNLSIDDDSLRLEILTWQTP